MRKTIALGLAAMMILMTPAGSFAALRTVRSQPGAGVITGIARDATGIGVAGARIRVRNASFGDIASQVQADGRGGFSATGLKPGKYLVEASSPSGQLIAVSPVSVAAGTTAAVVLSTSTSALPSALQAQPQQSRRPNSALWWGIGAAAAGAGILAWVVTSDDDSPSN